MEYIMVGLVALLLVFLVIRGAARTLTSGGGLYGR